MDRYEKINKRNTLKTRRKYFSNINNNARKEIWKLNALLDESTNKEEIEKYTIKKEKLHKVETHTREKIYDISGKLNAKIYSELPLLLFAINESRISSNSYEPMWEYVYYYPDYDEVIKVKRLSTISLNHKDINLTDLFHDFGMPKELLSNSINYGSLDDKYDDVINNAVETTKTIIDKIFEENEIDSWADVGTHLEEYVKKHNKEESKKGKKNLQLI